MGIMAINWLFVQQVIQANDKENIKALQYGFFVRGSAMPPHKKGQ